MGLYGRFDPAPGNLTLNFTNMINNEKDKALFVAFYYWQVGHPKATLWQTFGDVYAMAEKFVQTYSPEDTWEDTSFEDYMVEFIQKHTN